MIGEFKGLVAQHLMRYEKKILKSEALQFGECTIIYNSEMGK